MVKGQSPEDTKSFNIALHFDPLMDCVPESFLIRTQVLACKLFHEFNSNSMGMLIDSILSATQQKNVELLNFSLQMQKKRPDKKITPCPRKYETIVEREQVQL